MTLAGRLPWSDEADGIQMLEQKDVLDYDSDGNTTEVTRSFYHRKALGSVMEITDMNQAEVVSYRYDPYGRITITRSGTTQSFDPLGNHWTFTGRFMQRDPLGYAPSPSLFAYVTSSPPNGRDPSGLDTLVSGDRVEHHDDQTNTTTVYHYATAEEAEEAAEPIENGEEPPWPISQETYEDPPAPEDDVPDAGPAPPEDEGSEDEPGMGIGIPYGPRGPVDGG